MTKRCTSFSCISLALVFLVACGESPVKIAAQGDIIVTELMPNLNDGESQWLELHNTTEAPVNLGKCEISNTRKQKFSLTDNIIIEPQDYIVIASKALNDKPLPQALNQANLNDQTDSFELPESGGISLSCKGEVIDKMTYKIGAPTIAASARSWQLEPRSTNAKENDNEEKWCYTIMIKEHLIGDRRFATPGKANPICASVMPYISYNDQKPVLIEGIDWDATLKVAEAEFARKLSTSELPIWGIRDQIVTPELAAKIAILYFDNIEMLYDTAPFTRLDWNHAVWHFAWAISNLYRNGDAAVKKELQIAYEDAIKRPETLERFNYIAIDHIRNDVVVMGDIHTPAHKRMKQLIVVPGNPEYLQSYDEYLENQRSPLVLKAIHGLYTVKTFFSP